MAATHAAVADGAIVGEPVAARGAVSRAGARHRRHPGDRVEGQAADGVNGAPGTVRLHDLERDPLDRDAVLAVTVRGAGPSAVHSPGALQVRAVMFSVSTGCVSGIAPRSGVARCQVPRSRDSEHLDCVPRVIVPSLPAAEQSPTVLYYTAAMSLALSLAPAMGCVRPHRSPTTKGWTPLCPWLLGLCGHRASARATGASDEAWLHWAGRSAARPGTA